MTLYDITGFTKRVNQSERFVELPEHAKTSEYVIESIGNHRNKVMYNGHIYGDTM